MSIKITISELKSYIIDESKKLYKKAVLREKILKNISESNEKNYVSNQFYSVEELQKIRQDLIKKAAGWDFPQNTEEILSEINRAAMKAAKDDIETSGGVFKPLGKSEFEKNINKNSLKKAMSPEKIGENEESKTPTLSNKTIDLVNKWISENGERTAAVKIVDFFLNKMLGLSSSDLPDTVTFADGLDEIESSLAQKDYVGAFMTAKETAKSMISEEGGDFLF